MKRLAIACLAAASLVLSSCAGLGALMGPPPTAAALQSTQIDEAGIDLVRDLFDVALYGVDAMTDLRRPCCVPGTPEARNLARLIRQVAGFLGGAEAARRAGSASSYNEALTHARAALRQFQQAIGMPASPSAALTPDQARAFAARLDRTDADRLALADRLETPAP